MPIGELSRRIGVSTDVLRKWERRYGVLKPGRTLGNQRLYSQVDEARLRLMIKHVHGGMSPAQAAEVAAAARFRINAKPLAVAGGLTTSAGSEMVAALARYDETAAEQVLEKLLDTHPATTIIRDVFLPVLGEVGDRWAQGTLVVAQEHFASTFIHSRLLGMARGWDRGLGPKALLACPSGEQHAMGLIAFGIALHQIGWRITYLGPDTPVGAVAEAAARITPALIVLAGAVAGGFEGVGDEIRRLSARWRVALGGAASSPKLAEALRAEHLAHDPITAAQSLLT
jgi:DNA-binding transcriptional MerR regulator